MERIVIHSDLNNFYASVERKEHPELIGVPVAVCGDPAQRKGVVLAKSEEAKRCGVKTGDALWLARQKCPNIVCVKANFPLYMEYSRKVRNIYAQYTDYIENYGIDECWLDVTQSILIFPEYKGNKKTPDGEHWDKEYLRFMGDTLREHIKREIGLTVSVGVSFNKVYAKLGSDLKKPDGTTVIGKVNYEEVVYGLPVDDLLYIGKKTGEKLHSMGFDSIGDLALADKREEEKLFQCFGKNGKTMLTNARGLNEEPVLHMDERPPLKSIGNSQTYPHDLVTYAQVERSLIILCESVTARLRESGLGKANTVHLWVRFSTLQSFTVQKKVRHTELCSEVVAHVIQLFHENVGMPFSIRSLGVSISGFEGDLSQITLEEASGRYEKLAKVEQAVDAIRKKHGYRHLQRGVLLLEPAQMGQDLKNMHLIKPARFDDPEEE